MAERRIDIFFYGLFMDADLLREKAHLRGMFPCSPLRTPMAVALLCAACASSTCLPAGEVDAAGSAERAFKGYELYSWRTDQGEWRYALVAGTNRLKAWSELEAEAGSEAELRRRLTELASGESVSWCNRAVSGATSELMQPPKAKVQALLDLARGNEIDLNPCDQKERSDGG